MPYASAVGAVLVAVLLRWLLTPWLGDQLPFATVFCAISVAVWAGGYRPALLAAALGYVACAWILFDWHGLGSLSQTGNLYRFLTYLVCSGIIIACGGTMHAALRRAEAQQRQLMQVTELQNRAEAQLRDARRQLATTLEAAEIGTCVYDLVQKTVQGDDHFAHMFGVSLEKTRTAPLALLHERIHPDDREHLAARLERAVASAETYEAEHRIVLPDGRVRWVFARGGVERDDAGSVVRLPGVVVDISDRKRAEESLREERELFRTTLASIGDGVITTDIDRRVTFLNPVAEKLTGWTKEEACGKPLEDVFRTMNEQSRPGIESTVTKALREGHRLGLANHTVLIARDGTERPIEESAAPIRHLEGSVAGVVLVFRDCTERIRAEQALRLSEQRWRTMAEALPNLLWIDLLDGQCDWLSSQWGKYTGIAETELLGLQWVDKVLHPEDRERTLTSWMAACADEADYDIEFRIRRQDGAYRWFKTRGVPIRNEQGKIIAWFGTCTDIEDNKRLEEAFRRQQAVLTIAETAAGIGHFEWEISSDECHWSTELEALFGLPSGGFEGGSANWRNLIHTDDRVAAAAAVQESLSTGRLQAEYRVVWPDGTVRWLEARACVAKNGSGQAARMVGIHMDVTDRKRIEEEERAGRMRLKMALAAARMVAWEYDPASGTVVSSDTAAEVFGLRPGDTVTTGEQGFALIHPDDLPRHRATMMKAFEESGAYLSHFRMIRPDNGAVIWLEERGHAFSAGLQKAVRLISVVMDVTERKLQELRLKESEERLSAVIEAIPQIVWTAQTSGEVDFGNRHWYDYTGLTPEQTVGVAWMSAVHPDDRASTAAKWQVALATSEPIEIEYRLRAANGCYRWQLIRGVPLKNREGQVLKWFGTITDIHDLKLAERALQENDRRKDEFLATLAHELRNPLAPLRNGLQVMRLSVGNPDALEKTRTMMERQLIQLVRLVDDLLDVSRISSGKLELKKERVPLEAVLNSAIETSRPLIEQMGHELSVQLPKQWIVIEADLTRLAQVFLNLLNNAAKYSDKGGHIWLTAERQGSDVVVSVKDKGIGIAADQLPYIFDMFSQVNCSLDKAQGGLGIGLTLVKRLVEMHEGRIEARSEGLGTGSEFVVRLPLVVEASVTRAESP
jgi:PAS domain S-box-containing protein